LFGNTSTPTVYPVFQAAIGVLVFPNRKTALFGITSTVLFSRFCSESIYAPAHPGFHAANGVLVFPNKPQPPHGDTGAGGQGDQLGENLLGDRPNGIQEEVLREASQAHAGSAFSLNLGDGGILWRR
jgi:hypothetical protein